MAKNKLIETNIEALVPDNKNMNKGTQYGQKLIEDSLRKFGAGRSILIDKNNRIIGGNKTVENAVQIGLDDVIVVETTGNQIVAVKRTDVDLDTQFGREFALADNATSFVNLEWDEATIAELSEEFELDPHDWGVDIEASDEEPEEPKHGRSSSEPTVMLTFETEEDAERFMAEQPDMLRLQYRCAAKRTQTA